MSLVENCILQVNNIDNWNDASQQIIENFNNINLYDYITDYKTCERILCY
jgi:hypothetical protein